MLPLNAKEIWDLRLEGKRPNGAVLISMIGDLATEQWCVEVRDSDDIDALDFRWVIGLQVCIVFASSTDRSRVKKLAESVVRHRPVGPFKLLDMQGHVYLWNVTTQRGWMLSWWDAFPAIPPTFPGAPEELKMYPMMDYETKAFNGVGL